MKIAKEVLVEYFASTLAHAHFTHHIELELILWEQQMAKTGRAIFFSFSPKRSLMTILSSIHTIEANGEIR